MRTADAGAGMNVVSMIDVFIVELGPSVASCLMLNDSASIVRIIQFAHRTYGNSRTVAIHRRQSLIGITVGHTDDERPSHVRSGDRTVGDVAEHVGGNVVERHAQPSVVASSPGDVELRVAPFVGRVEHATLIAHGHCCRHVEILSIGLVGLYAEEIFHFLFHVSAIGAVGNILGIVAVAHKEYVDAVALGMRLQGLDGILVSLIVVLLYRKLTGDGVALLIIAVEGEDDLACAVASPVRHIVDDHLQLGLLRARSLTDMRPRGTAGHAPFAVGIEHHVAHITLVEQFGLHGPADKVAISRDTLEFFPVWGVPVSLNSPFGYHHRKVVFFHTAESTCLNGRRLAA